MHNGCLQAAKRNRKWPRQKLLLFLDQIQQGMTHNVNTHVHLGELEDIYSQTRRGPPRSHCMHQDTDGPLWDDQWWALWAWTALQYHPCIPPWEKAPWKTNSKAIQDTLQQAGWHHCEPLCHPTCLGTCLPQLQTGGCNLPGQAVSDPHQPQQQLSHTIFPL